MEKDKQKIFISCGQRTDEEKALGITIVKLIEELTPFEPYFAEEQTTLEGLTKNIFGALNHAAGFIAVIHRRGVVSPGGIRASVWVEQEIAIAAFLQQTLGRDLHVAAYLQPGITVEGVRAQLLLNPVEFKSNDEVIDHLKRILPTWKTLSEAEELNPLSVAIKYERVNIRSERHDYRLVVLLTNIGTSPVSKYHIELEFPAGLIENVQNLDHYVPGRATDDYSFFRATQKAIGEIFPGDSYAIMKIPYYVTDEIFDHRGSLLKSIVKVSVYTEGYAPKVIKKSMAELQIF